MAGPRKILRRIPPSLINKSCRHNTLARGMEMVSVHVGYGAAKRPGSTDAPARSGPSPQQIAAWRRCGHDFEQVRPMRTNRPGFTLIEMLTVVVIGAVLTGVAVGAFGRLTARQNAENARNALVHLGVRARSSAIERGERVILTLDPARDVANVRTESGELIETTRFRDEFGVDVTTDGDEVVTVCYTPRGFAQQGACTNVVKDLTVTFRAGNHSKSARVKALGQVEAL